MTNEKKIFFSLALPSRILSYEKIVKGERNDKRKKIFFQFDIAEPHPVL